MPPKKQKRKHAVALKYEETDKAPVVVATGAGELAKRILDLAEQHKVPIHRNDTLIDILSRLDVGTEIPPETYKVVAEILAFLFRTDKEWRDRKLKAGEPVAQIFKKVLPPPNR